MPDLRVDAPYVGPFKLGEYVRSECPLDEIWNWVSRIGITSWLQRNTSGPVPFQNWGPYAVARVRQSIELRAAARQGSILTRPLPLYYSLLNLMSGFFAIIKDAAPRNAHGLKFKGRNEPDIFQTAAEMTEGAFTDYLDALGVSHQNGTQITLQDALLRIIETAQYYISSPLGQPEVFGVRVEAFWSGKVLLHFAGPGQEAEFRDSWQQWFPKLNDFCSQGSTGRILLVDTNKVDTGTYETVCKLCHELLKVNLKSYEDPTWFAIRHSTPKLDLPRPALYFIGAFILSSVVRYEPELMAKVSNPDSEQGWLIARFLDAAERYFPQLLLHWWFGKFIYF